MNTISFKRITRSDEADLLTFHKESFGDAAWKDFKILEQPTVGGWFVEADGDKAGFILCSLIPGAEAEIMTFCVSPHLRKQKLGSMLVATALNFAQRQKCRKVFLEVASDNEAAKQLYEKIGFKLAGKRPNYYQQGRDSAVDALIYEIIPKFD